MFSISSKKQSPRNRRLSREYDLLEALCKRSDKISFEISQQLGNNPPEGYTIFYKVKSITGIKPNLEPVYGTRHAASILLPPEYPGPEGDPICYMKTDVWHPNIRYHGHHKGRICITAKALGAWHSLDMLVLRIGEILQYKNYLAENIPPYPEDEKVAKWVREYAEPNGLVNARLGIALDQSELLRPLEGFEPRPAPQKLSGKIKVGWKTDAVEAPLTNGTAKTEDAKRIKIKLFKK